MTTPTLIPLCWICGKRVDLATCKTDEYGEAVHEACYTTRLVFEKGIGRPNEERKAKELLKKLESIKDKKEAELNGHAIFRRAS